MSTPKTFFICLPVFFAVLAILVGLVPNLESGMPLYGILATVTLAVAAATPVLFAKRYGYNLLAHHKLWVGIMCYVANVTIWLYCASLLPLSQASPTAILVVSCAVSQTYIMLKSTWMQLMHIHKHT